MSVSKYQRLRDGEVTTADDPDRGIWYSVGCGFWTDEWDQLKTVGPGIPCCPTCKAPGMQATAKDWLGGAEEYEAAGNLRYVEFLQTLKNNCSGRGFQPLEAHKAWLAKQTDTE